MAPPPLEAKTPDTKQSIEEMLQELMPGQRFEVVPRVTNLGNGIQATRAAFASSWFSEEGCGKGQARLSNYRKKWDQRNGRFTSEPAHNGDGHGWDAYRHFGQVHEAWERFAMSIAPATAKNGAKRRGNVADGGVASVSATLPRGGKLSKFRTALGVLLSIGWIYIAFLIYDGSDRPTKANEWGDYLAGMCSPLAFLWLVLGYLQQGDELKHSTEALKLQARELHDSVQHQGAIAELTRLQLEKQLDEARAREKQLSIQARADFRVYFKGAYGAPGGMRYGIELHNSGGPAYDISITGDHMTLDEVPPERMDTGDKRSFAFTCNPYESPSIWIHYRDGRGSRNTARWDPAFAGKGTVYEGSFKHVSSNLPDS